MDTLQDKKYVPDVERYELVIDLNKSDELMWGGNLNRHIICFCIQGSR
jgi:hypothetical protein